MQMFGWTLQSCWMLLTVISVCSCGDIGSSSTEINDEVMEEQPWIWNEFKLAGELRSKFHSILGDEDNDSIADEPAQSSTVAKATSNFREEQEQQQEQQQQHRVAGSEARPNVEDDYIYDVEGRPLTGGTGRLQFYAKPSDKKRSQHQSPNGQLSGRRRQLQLQRGASTSSTTGGDANSPPSLSVVVSDAEPRVLPLLGFHAAVNKINRPKEALLKKILRQADAAEWTPRIRRHQRLAADLRHGAHYSFSIPPTLST